MARGYQAPPKVPMDDGYKDLIIRKYNDRSRGLEVIMNDLWTLTETNAIPSAISKARRVYFNNLKKEGVTEDDD